MAIGLVDERKAVDGWRKQPHAVVVDGNGVLADLLAASLESYYGMHVAISERLGIRVQTVETHRKSIAKKLRATGVELVRIAVLYVSHSGSFFTSGDEDDE